MSSDSCTARLLLNPLLLLKDPRPSRTKMRRYKSTPQLRTKCNPWILEWPRLVYWGIGVTADQLTDYARRRNLYDHNDHSRDCPLRAWQRAVERLNRNLDIKVCLRYTISPDYDFVIGLFSNLDLCDPSFTVYGKEDERPITDAIQRKMRVVSPPLWHLDQQRHARRRIPWAKLEQRRMIQVAAGKAARKAARKIKAKSALAERLSRLCS